ncbi:MAG TPA: type II secretion system protein N, partial [Spongiibacteraceae bacterium]|nr:type II secretion system protein N [Spongiibacteraceae bacterium]
NEKSRSVTTTSEPTTASVAAIFDRRWRRRVLLAAALWFLWCLSYNAPATLFESLAHKLLPQLHLQNVSGSFWNGSATQAFWLQGPQSNQAIALGSVEWHLQPWSLLWLHPSAHVATKYGEQFVDARVQVSPLGKVTLSNTSAALPASLLSNWAPIPARGQIALKLERAALSHAQVTGLNGALYWQQAQWQWSSRWLALGDYRCELTMPASQQIRCALQGQGQLALDGAVDVDTKAQNWAVQLQVKAAESLPEDFRRSLQLMLATQPDAQGRFAVKRSGHW